MLVWQRTCAMSVLGFSLVADRRGSVASSLPGHGDAALSATSAIGSG